jgi:indole-3-glycerol phosphate synthase
MAERSMERVIAAEAGESRDALMRRALETPSGPRWAPPEGGFGVLAEIKPRSPAEGALAHLSPEGAAARAQAYAAAGATAISVLTEPDEFGGSLAHCAAVAAAVDIPVMRKDFVVDGYQLHEARAAGARGVLLIVKLLSEKELVTLVSTAEDLDLFALVECFDAADCERAKCVSHRDPVWMGLNCRDLTTLQIAPQRFEELRAKLPGSGPRVAESGCHTPDDAARVAALGYDLALVGTALMRRDDPGALIAEMLAAGRAAKEPRS